MRGELFPISQVPGQAVYIAEYPKNDNSPRNPEQDKKRIEDDYEDKLIVVKVNVNFDAELAQKYEVAASPTLLFFKEGKEANRIRGLVKRKELEEAVEEIL